MPDQPNPLGDLAAEKYEELRLRGNSEAQARRSLAERNVPPEFIEAAAERYRKKIEVVIQSEPHCLSGSRVVPWYTGPQEDSALFFWPKLRDHLRQRSWAPSDLTTLDGSSTSIVAALQNPRQKESFNIRGLVVGYVQSGKTASYAAVIAKAADAGYRHIIVVTGTTEKLRRQTQSRLLKELHELDSGRWIALTSLESDAEALHERNAAAILSSHSLWSLSVVKKNARVLRRIADWFRSAGPSLLNTAPVLVIDDEADEASINTARIRERRSAVNGRMRELAGLPKVSYVAYTATPFANLLINPDLANDDLYPRDFIADLPRPDSYFGPERLFGRDLLPADEDEAAKEGMDVIRIIPDAEAQSLRVPSREQRESFQPGLTGSLQEAIRWFLLTVAARKARGQVSEHSTMLVHTSQYVAAHRSMAKTLRGELSRLVNAVKANDENEMSALRAQWVAESEKVDAKTVGATFVDWMDVSEFLVDAVEHTSVVVENASEGGLDYERKDGSSYIVVGGNVLARGLTLEGLTVSFFLRTAGAYDTLLQMGRWFGYRPGYGDLPRIWMTQDLSEKFRDLATVEQEIRLDIKRYRDDNLTPLQFGVRIRKHSSLLITSPLKMRDAVTVSTSFFGSRPQTILFKHRDGGWLQRNIEATRNLIRSARKHGEPSNTKGGILFPAVPVNSVLEFFSRYELHEKNQRFTRKLICKFIEQARAKNLLLEWDIAIVQPRTAHGPPTDAIDELPGIRMVTRNRLKGRSDSDKADIGALLSPPDLAIGLDDSVDPNLPAEKLLAARAKAFPGRAMLLLYLINPESSPRTKDREALGASDIVVGAAISFPEPEGDGVGVTIEEDYVQARVPEELLEDEDPETDLVEDDE